VDFFAHKIDPEFERAAKTLHTRDHSSIRMTAVMVDANSDFAKKHKIEHLPSKHWCVKGECTHYNGGAAHEDITNFVLKSSKAIDTIKCEGLSKTVMSKNHKFDQIKAVYFGDRQNALFNTFEHALGRPRRDMQFLETDASCATEHKLSSPSIALYRNFDTSPIEWKGEGTDGEATLTEWLNKFSMPHFFELTMEYAEAIFHHEQNAVYYITDDAAQRSSKVSNFA